MFKVRSNWMENAALHARKVLYSVMHEMMRQYTCSPLMFRLFTVLEAMQLLYFSFHVDFTFTTVFFEYMIIIIQYFHVNYLLTANDIGTILLYVILALEVLLIIVFIAVAKLLSGERKISAFLSYSLKILSFFGFCQVTFLQIPIYSILLANLICIPGSIYTHTDECYQGLQIMHTAFAALGFIVYIFITTVYGLLYVDLNPSSDVPFAAPQSKHNLQKSVFKFTLTLYIMLDYRAQYAPAYTIILTILYFLFIVQRFLNPHMYHRSIFYHCVFCDALMFFPTLCVVFHDFLDEDDPDNIGFFYMVLATPFTFIATILIYELKEQYIATSEFRYLRREHLMEHYILLLVHMIERRENNAKYRVIMEGMVTQHMRTCINDDCPCRQLFPAKLSQEGQLWFQFVEVLVQEGLTRYPKSYRFHLLNAFLQKDKLNNRFQALYELLLLDAMDTSMQVEFTVYRCKFEMEQDMKDEDEMEVDQIVNFQNEFVEFQSRVLASVNCHLEFWRELQEESPDNQKLQQLGSQITYSVESVEECYKHLMQVNNAHVRSLQIYGHFLKDVINNDIEGPRILEKADQIIKSLQANQSSDDKDYANAAMVQVSCNEGQLGQILNINRELTKILGFTKRDLDSQQVQRIMPKVFGDHHDDFIRQYLRTNQSSIIDKERFVMAINKEGFIIPCTLLLKVLPMLDKGIQVVGFLRKVEEEDHFYVLYHPKTFQILGITANCQNKLGIPAQLVYGNSHSSSDFTLNYIVQEMRLLEQKQEEAEATMLQPNFALNIDTTNLPNNFHIERNDDSGTDLHDEMLVTPMVKFTHLRVKCHIVRQTYRRIQLNILKFTEIDDTQDWQQKSSNRSDPARERVKKKRFKRASNQAYISNLEAEIDQEDRSSVNSLGSVQSSLNDDMRSLKDFKAMISEKAVPTQIRNLQYTLLSLSGVLFVMTSLDLYFKNTHTNQFQEGLRGMESDYGREETVSDLVYYARYLNAYATGMAYTNMDQEVMEIKQNISFLVDSLQDLQFQRIRNAIQLENMGVSMPTYSKYEFQSLLQNGQRQTYSLGINDAIIQFINQGTILMLQPLEAFNQSKVEAQQSFFFINHNGIEVLRVALEEITNLDYETYRDLIESKLDRLLVFLILCQVFLIMAQIILIPIMNNVRRTNVKVLSLFGLIPLQEIKLLADKCDEFLKHQIDDSTQEQQMQAPQVVLMKSSNHNDDAKSKKSKGSKQERKQQADEIYFEVNNEDPELTPHTPLQPRQPEPVVVVKVEPEKTELLEKTPKPNEVDQALEEQRVEKLQQTQGMRQQRFLFQFGIFFFLFCGFFLAQFLVEYFYLNVLQQMQEHMNLIFRRPIIVQYTLLLAIEEVARQQASSIKPIYYSRFYENERDIFESMKMDFPSTLEDYRQTFNDMNYGDLCQNLPNANLTKSWCQSVSNGILEKGIRTAVVSFALSSQDHFHPNSPPQQVFNSQQLLDVRYILTFIIPSLQHLNELFVEQLLHYMDNQYNLNSILFTIFILSWILLILIMWIPHFSTLSNQIWRTKGMLNMIPLPLIQKYDRLKDAFLHSNILQMVK